MADKVIVEKAFDDEKAVLIIKAAIESGAITLAGPLHPQFKIPQKNADFDAAYLKALYGALTSSSEASK